MTLKEKIRKARVSVILAQTILRGLELKAMGVGSVDIDIADDEISDKELEAFFKEESAERAKYLENLGLLANQGNESARAMVTKQFNSADEMKSLLKKSRQG